ncbi:hypothetical protein KC845_03655 [Candidatus Kaiserbacteria bacterium]|nr:hypothetical protein [Candidatus Kaiserbacteria bacterium]
MEPEQPTPETESSQSVWNTVTPLLQISLAMALFVILPFVGGYIGYTLAPEKVVERIVIKEVDSEFAVNDSYTDGLDDSLMSEVSSRFVLPEGIILAAPDNCLPDVPKNYDEKQSRFYATQSDVDAMMSLVVGETYGSFVYEGYECHSYSGYSGALGVYKTINIPTLYFSGTAEFTGNDFFGEMGGTEHFKIEAEDVNKLPEIAVSDTEGYPSFKYISNSDGETYYTDNFYGSFGTTTTLVVDGLIYGQVGSGHQSYYGGVVPNVIESVVVGE